MGTRITWEEFNISEEGHRVYRSESSIDTQNLPTPHAELGPDVTQYDDGDTVPGTTYFYLVSAYIGSVEKFSNEIQVTATEVEVFSVLRELVRYTFDTADISGGFVTDQKGNSDGELIGTVDSGPGIDGESAVFSGDGRIALSPIQGTYEAASASIWVKETNEQGAFVTWVNQNSSGDVLDAFLLRFGCTTSGGDSLPDFRVTSDENPALGLNFKSDLSDGNWHHILATYGPKYGHRLYVDGVLDAEINEYPGHMEFQSQEKMVLGSDYRSQSSTEVQHPMTGSLDQFHWYSRELEPSDAVRLYNEFTPGF